MNLEPVDEHHYFSFGRSVHVGLAAWYNPTGWALASSERLKAALEAFEIEEHDQLNARRKALNLARFEMTVEEEREWSDRLKMGRGMLEHFAVFSEQHDREWTPLFVEVPFEVPLRIYADSPYPTSAVTIAGTVDLVMQHDDGGIWVFDHKTKAQIKDLIAHVELDTQISTYCWALHSLGIPVQGFVYQELLKASPETPKPLKRPYKGRWFSTNKQNAVTYEAFLAALKDHDEPLEEYEDYLVYLKNAKNRFFRRTPVHRSARELAVVQRNLQDEALDMVSAPSIYPNPSEWNCGSCKFRAPCLVRQEGGDPDFLLSDKSQYRKRDNG